jgi:transposase-like protein
MDQSPFQDRLSGIVEIDETFVGGKAKNMHKGDRERKITGRGGADKAPVVSLVERKGNVRSMTVPDVTAYTLKAAVRENVETESRVMTDQLRSYDGLDYHFASHEIVDHGSKEYARGDVHTNTAEGYFANLKRGINGVYHHVSREHLHRYLSEFDFRYNTKDMTDGARTMLALEKSEGKRLQYRSLES